MNRLKCWLGFHKWRCWDHPLKADDSQGNYSYWVVKTCTRCNLDDFIPSVVNGMRI